MPQFPAILQLSALDGSDGFRINGAKAGDKTGFAVSAAGDINGDGLDDIIVGAYRAGPNGDYSGSAYVIFGKGGARGPVLNLSALRSSDGFRINGARIDDQLGRAVDAAGDVNGDGIGDLIVGAPGTDSAGQYSNSGSAYVIYGTRSGFPATLQASAIGGGNGFRLDGGSSIVDRNHQAGHDVSGAGDVNGDGIGDMIVGAYRADHNGRISGSSYVVFGLRGPRPSLTDLRTLNGVNGFRLDGPVTGASAGYSLDGAGDVNGDGFDDLIIGAFRSSPHGGGILYSGSTYVVYGKKSGFAPTLNLGTLNGNNGFRLDGPTTQNPQSGRSVSSAGDINGDRIDDMIIGSHLGSVNGVRSGVSYVVFGKAGGLPAIIQLSALNGANGFRIDGDNTGDVFGTDVSAAGDVNGDGFGDLIVGASGARVSGDDSGASYVIYGKATAFAATLPVTSLKGVGGFRIDGVTDYDISGRSVSAAGDVNGDGFDDLIVGAPAAGSAGPDSGAAFIIYGRGPGGSINRAGNASSQSLAGGDQDDSLEGLGGNDSLHGNGGKDTLDGGVGRDRVDGGEGDDQLAGGAGRDTVKGGWGDDILSGGENNDDMGGGAGDDVLNGGAGADRLFGGYGEDVLIGGAGQDRLVGGDQADRFFFVTNAWGGDIIADFEDGRDLLRFTGTTADDIADFAITGNGTREVTLAIGAQTLVLHGERPILLTNDDFQFLV